MNVDDVVAEIRKLRLEKIMFDEEANLAKANRQVLQDEESRLRKLFEEQLAAIAHRRMALTQEVVTKVNQAKGRVGEIEALQRQLTELQANQDQMQRLAEIEAKVRKYLEGTEAYSKIREYQLSDIVFTIDAYLQGKGGVLNANEMSLGKTFETILSLIVICLIHEEDHGYFPSMLWLTKKSLVKSSTREIKHWTDKINPVPVVGATVAQKNSIIDMFKKFPRIIFVTNYESVRTVPYFKSTKWDLIVIDEVHKLKGGAAYKPSQIWQDVRDAALQTKFLFMLSGTPMQNKVAEMWAYLHIFDPERFPSFRDFEKAYCNLKVVAGQAEMTIDVDRLLKNALQGRMIKRTKKEVGIQLPTLSLLDVDVEHNEDQAELYKNMRDRFYIWLEQATEESEGKGIGATAVIAQLIRLRQINTCPAGIKIKDVDGNVTILDASSAKIDEFFDRYEELENEQIIVSSNFNEPLFEIQRRIKEMGKVCKVIYGGDQGGDYEEMFQQGKIDVLCINMSMGEGLNLHKNPERWPGGSSTLFLFDKWWNPSRSDQIIGRIHRPGAIEPCSVYYLRTPSSVDEFLEFTCETKALAIAGVEDSDTLRPPDEWKQLLAGKI